MLPDCPRSGEKRSQSAWHRLRAERHSPLTVRQVASRHTCLPAGCAGTRPPARGLGLHPTLRAVLGVIAHPAHGRSRGGGAAEWGFGAALAETRPQAGRARVVPWGRPGGLMPERRLVLPATTSLDADRPGVSYGRRGVWWTHTSVRDLVAHTCG